MYRIGIDLGGTNIAVGLVDENYKIIEKYSTPTLAKRPSDDIADDMAMACRKVCEIAGVDMSAVDAVGIAAPGVANHDKGVIEYSCNLPFIKYPIAEVLKSKLPEVALFSVENDANAAAWGEAVAGAAKGTSNSVMITLGTGVGGGIIIDNKICSGHNFAGGELGHIVIEFNGRPCSCGRRGCWETYSSATALVAMTKEKLDECARTGRKTLMTDIVAQQGKINGRTTPDAMRMGDEAAKEVYDVYVRYLACGLTNIVNIFQPEVISLGGGISNEGQSLIDAVLPDVHKYQYGSGFVDPADIRIAKLGNDAGIIGAACLGL